MLAWPLRTTRSYAADGHLLSEIRHGFDGDVTRIIYGPHGNELTRDYVVSDGRLIHVAYDPQNQYRTLTNDQLRPDGGEWHLKCRYDNEGYLASRVEQHLTPGEPVLEFTSTYGDVRPAGGGWMLTTVETRGGNTSTTTVFRPYRDISC